MKRLGSWRPKSLVSGDIAAAMCHALGIVTLLTVLKAARIMEVIFSKGALMSEHAYGAVCKTPHGAVQGTVQR
jgi:hypothetical protein